MDIINDVCPHVVSRSIERGGSGDPSPMTALGVFQGMRASAEYRWGDPSLWGRRVGIEGIGKVGCHLAKLLVADGAQVVVTDVDDTAIDRVRALGDVQVVTDVDDLLQADLDIYAPCALGGALNERSTSRLTAEIVCGAANNQLAESGIAEALDERGVLYAPDYLVNAGGLIQVADEFGGFDADRVYAKVTAIRDTLKQVYALAATELVTPVAAADHLAEQRMARARSKATRVEV